MLWTTPWPPYTSRDVARKLTVGLDSFDGDEQHSWQATESRICSWRSCSLAGRGHPALEDSPPAVPSRRGRRCGVKLHATLDTAARLAPRLKHAHLFAAALAPAGGAEGGPLCGKRRRCERGAHGRTRSLTEAIQRYPSAKLVSKTGLVARRHEHEQRDKAGEPESGVTHAPRQERGAARPPGARTHLRHKRKLASLTTVDEQHENTGGTTRGRVTENCGVTRRVSVIPHCCLSLPRLLSKVSQGQQVGPAQNRLKIDSKQ